jgi:hypothetical protein
MWCLRRVAPAERDAILAAGVHVEHGDGRRPGANPRHDNLDAILRYERRLSGQLYRAMHEIAQSQARRRDAGDHRRLSRPAEAKRAKRNRTPVQARGRRGKNENVPNEIT